MGFPRSPLGLTVELLPIQEELSLIITAHVQHHAVAVDLRHEVTDRVRCAVLRLRLPEPAREIEPQILRMDGPPDELLPAAGDLLVCPRALQRLRRYEVLVQSRRAVFPGEGQRSQHQPFPDAQGLDAPPRSQAFASFRFDALADHTLAVPSQLPVTMRWLSGE